MKVFITGSVGRLGSRLVEHLAGRYELVCYDRAEPPADLPDGVRLIRGDIRDADRLSDHMAGVDAVVHLGAIPGAVHWMPQGEIFQINTQGTFNTLQAAARHSVKLAVIAGSLCAVGFPPSLEDHGLAYLPLDEDHPCRPRDVYDLSKQLIEHTAAMFTRTTGMTTICFRFPALADVRTSPWLPGVVRADRPRLVLGDYLDFADACRIIELAMTRTDLQHEVVFANATTFGNAQPTPEYLKRFVPAVEWRGDAPSDTTPLINCAKLEQLFGYTPEIIWQQGMAAT